MIKKLLLVSFVAVFAYYVGYNGLTPKNLTEWLDKKEISETIEDVLNKTIKMAEQK